MKYNYILVYSFSIQVKFSKFTTKWEENPLWNAILPQNNHRENNIFWLCDTLCSETLLCNHNAKPKMVYLRYAAGHNEWLSVKCAPNEQIFSPNKNTVQFFEFWHLEQKNKVLTKLYKNWWKECGL